MSTNWRTVSLHKSKTIDLLQEVWLQIARHVLERYILTVITSPQQLVLLASACYQSHGHSARSKALKESLATSDRLRDHNRLSAAEAMALSILRLKDLFFTPKSKLKDTKFVSMARQFRAFTDSAGWPSPKLRQLSDRIDQLIRDAEPNELPLLLRIDRLVESDDEEEKRFSTAFMREPPGLLEWSKPSPVLSQSPWSPEVNEEQVEQRIVRKVGNVDISLVGTLTQAKNASLRLSGSSL